MLKYSLFAMLVAACVALNTNGNVTPKNCSLSGIVRDSSTLEVVPFAALKLVSSFNDFETTAFSDINGAFCFNNIPVGTYSLFASYVGYKNTVAQNISLPASNNLTIDIAPLNNVLKEVYVSEQKVVNRCEPMRLVPDLYDRIDAGNVKYKQRVDDSYSLFGGNITDHNTEEYSKIDDNGFKDARKNPLSTFSIDVDKASYSNVRRYITSGSLPPADAVRIEEMINYFSYGYEQPEKEEPFSISTQYAECPWNRGHHLIHIALQGQVIKQEKMQANNLVFLIDVSGSMDSPDKLPLLKSGLSLLIDQLRPQDKVSIVVYAGSTGLVLPATQGDKKQIIAEALDNLQAGGSTAGGAGIILAYKIARENFIREGNNRVILATDGDFNVGVSSEGEMIRLIEKERESGVFLSVLGFGTGNLKDSKMEQIADKGNGNYNYIDNILEAKKVLVKEMGGTLVTIAKDVKIQVEFNPSKVKAYRLVGYENRLLANEDFNDDKKDAGELGSGHSMTAIYEIIPASSTELIASVDSLKYQAVVSSPKSNSDEVMTVKFRYKDPQSNTSNLITRILKDKRISFSEVSDDFQFAAAVAEFGMVLRRSDYAGNANYNSVLAIARRAKGADVDGYRSEFIRLVEMAELLDKKK